MGQLFKSLVFCLLTSLHIPSVATQIILIGNDHKVEVYAQESHVRRTEVLISEIGIAMLLKQLSRDHNVIVFSENVPGSEVHYSSSFINSNSLELNLIHRQLNESFPAGSISDITEMHKRLFYDYGGPYMALIAGWVSELRGTGTSREASLSVIENLDVMVKQLERSGLDRQTAVMQVRNSSEFTKSMVKIEESALSEISKYIEERPAKNLKSTVIVLVFGYQHDFLETRKKFANIQIMPAYKMVKSIPCNELLDKRPASNALAFLKSLIGLAKRSF